MAKFGYKYFEVYSPDTERLYSPYGNDLKWDKPRGERPGKFMVQGGPLLMCDNGLHAWHTFAQCKADIGGDTNVRVFRVEAGINRVERSDKFCASKMRLLYEVSPKTGRRLPSNRTQVARRRRRRANQCIG